MKPPRPLKVATFPVSVDLNPKLFNIVKEVNRLAGLINTEARRAERAIQAMPFGVAPTLKNVGGQYTLDIFFHENAGYPIDGIIKYLKELHKQLGLAKNKAPEDSSTTTLKTNVEEIQASWDGMPCLVPKSN